VDRKNKIIQIDFYSVRPGFGYLPRVKEEIRKLLSEKTEKK